MKWETELTKLLGIKYPIVQGGLAYLAYAELAAAVSNSGGLGQITAMSLNSPEKLKAEIDKIRRLTNKPFSVNFAIGAGRRPYEEMVDAAVEAGVSIVSVTGGNPKGVLDRVKAHGIKSLVLTAETRQAQKAASLGADAVMVVGQEGGGHLGRNDIGTMVLTPKVVENVHIPVVASGGIVDGKGLMAALALGAQGIEMGTRFIATVECVHAHQQYKDDILNAGESDTTVIKRSLGTPARALKNNWTDEILNIEKDNLGYESIKDYISGIANKRYIYEGDYRQGFGWAGQAVARIDDISTVAELMKKIINEAEAIRKQWSI